MKISGGVVANFEVELRLTEAESHALAILLDRAPQELLDLLQPPPKGNAVRVNNDDELSYYDATQLVNIGKVLIKKLELVARVREMVKGAEVVEASKKT